MGIQFIAQITQKSGQSRSRKCIFCAFQRIFCHLVPRPAQIHKLSFSGVDHTIAHQNEAIIELYLKTIFTYCFPFDYTFFVRIIHNLFIPDKNAAWIVKFDEIRFSIVSNLKNAKRCIRRFPHFADRQGLCDRLHRKLNGSPIPKHCL